MKKIFTPRERVLNAIEHREVDRIPITFAGTVASAILECPPNGNSYTDLCHYLGLDDFEKPQIAPVFNKVLNVDERILKRFGSDFRKIGPNPSEVREEEDGTKTILGIWCGLRVKKMGYYDDVFEFPLSDITEISDILNYPYWPNEDVFKKAAEKKKEEIDNLRKKTDYSITYESPPLPFLMYPMLRGFENWFLDMKLNPKLYFAIADKLLEVDLNLHEEMLKQIGKYIDLATVWDDMGTQEGLLCSKDDYRKFIKPYEAEVIKFIKQHSNAKIIRHCCGSVYDIIPDFIEIGIDVLNPVQPLARNMEPQKLKNEFGNDIAFCGGVDIQELLPKANPEKVKSEVKKLIDIYAPGGGYILGPSHNFGPDIPPKNIVAMYEAALKYGIY